MSKLLLFLFVGIIITVNCSPQQYRERERYDRERYGKQSVVPSQNLYFVLSASNLPSKDSNQGLADPFVKVYHGIIPPYVKIQGHELDKLGDSEVLVNEVNPKWLKVFRVQYKKGTNQKLWVEVRDHDPINPDDIIGDSFIDLDEYMEMGGHLTVSLKGTKSGSLTMQNTAPFLFSLAVKSIPALDEFGGYSDPFVKCYFRYGKDGKDIKFYETRSIANTQSASWDDAITFDNYQRGTNQIFHFVVRDADTLADDDIGEAFMDVDAFVDKKMQSVLPLSSSHNATLLVKYVE